MSIAQIVLLLITVLLAAVLLGHYLLARRHRSHAGPPVRRPLSGPIFRDDERYWPGGLIYYNPDDPDLLVPRRFGIGQSLNFGHPRAKWFLIGVVVLMLLLTILSVFSGVALPGHHPSSLF
jgi:uncharacterized membrane protein